MKKQVLEGFAPVGIELEWRYDKCMGFNFSVHETMAHALGAALEHNIRKIKVTLEVEE